MAQAVLEAQQLVGQNRNQVHGQVVGGLVPQRVFNLAPHRAGGYAPYGRRVRLQDETPANITLANVLRIIGYDQTGLSSFGTTIGSTGSWELFRGTTVYQQRRTAYAIPSDAVHMANAGAYDSRDAFLVLDKERNLIEPLTAQTRAVSQAGAPAETSIVDNGTYFVDVAYGNGIFMAVTTNGMIYTSGDGLNWTEVADYSSGFLGLGYTVAQTIEYGNGVWIVGDRWWGALRSDDDGATWTPVMVAAPGFDRSHREGVIEMNSISYSSGDKWHATGDGNNGGGIWVSNDGGATWTAENDLQETGLPNSIHTGTRVATGGGGTSAVTVTASGTRGGSILGGRLYADVGITGSWGVFSSYVMADSTGWTWTDVAADRYIALSNNGQVAASPAWTGDPTAVDDAWSIVATFDGRLNKSDFNSDTGVLTVVGQEDVSFGSAPRIYQGSTPSGLTRQSALEDEFVAAGGGAMFGVASAPDGTTVYVGYSSDGSMSMVTTGSMGLRSGTYNIFYLTYANTEAGRLVVDYNRETLVFTADSGNSISIQAQSKDAIISGNAWLNTLNASDAAAAQAIVDSLRTDVYIQYMATTADLGEDDLSFTAATAENTIRYAFTFEFPDSGGEAPVGRELGELPIGRQLVTYGWPTTVIFEKSRTEDVFEPIRSFTAIHNGRVWGMARQDEVAWEAQGDDASLEIANQFNRFVLTYTETGWANLISDQNFVPIQPTQSQNFTGILGTPSGLMVMFDNEIFLVTGDAAFNNLAVDTYLDMVGCDLNTAPAMIGGLVFVIWEGKIWALQAGQAAEISQGQWRPDDPFVRVVAEPQTRSMLAMTASGLIFRYLVDDQFWFTDPMTTDAFSPFVLLPNAIDPNETDDQKGRARAVDFAGNVYVTYSDGTPDDPHLVYRDVDFGSPERRNGLYLAKVTIEGPLAAAEYDRDAVGYDATGLPALFYGSANASNGDTHESVDPQAGGIAPVASTPGARRVNTLSFRAPLGETKSYSMDLRFELRGMDYDDVVKLPVRLFYSTGGTTR